MCGARVCGPDGAGGSCGNCSATQACTNEGTCVARPCEPACSRGFTCVQTQCAVDPATQWDVIADSARVPERTAAGESWDIPGGLPDPLICAMDPARVQHCTPFAADTLTPRWDFLLFTARADALMGTDMSWLMNDDDFGPDEGMFSVASYRTTAEQLRAGSIVFMGAGSSTTFRLRAR